MTDKCPVCQADDEAFEEVADEFLDGTLEVAKRVHDRLVEEGRHVNDFGDAMLSGLIQAAVTTAFQITPLEFRDAVMQYMREYLEVAIENEKAFEAQRSTVQ